MPVVVITPPTPAVTAAEAKTAGVFASTDADAMVDALLGAAQAAIDGPDGWLGRSIGVQTLELRQPAFDRWRLTLPCGPVIEVLSIKYGPADTTWPAEQYALYSGGILGPVAGAWPSAAYAPDSVRIRYRAGYEPTGEPPVSTVPPPIRFAIMMMAAQLRAAGITETQLRSQTVEGVGSRTFLGPDDKAKMQSDAADRLLYPYRVYS